LLWDRSALVRRLLKGRVVRDAALRMPDRVSPRLRLRLALNLPAQEVLHPPLPPSLLRGEPTASPCWVQLLANPLCGYLRVVVASVL